jgi:hypothetical protein
VRPIGKKRDGRSGFALILTLSLLALLTLVVFATGVVVRTSLQVTEGQSARLRARQNAQLGLSVALKELQVAAGPDDVITGRSSVRAKSAANSGLMGWWLSTDTQAPSNWLVSGNFSPDAARSISYNLQPANAEPYETLVGDGSVSGSANYVRAKKIAVPAIENTGGGHFAFWVGDEGVKASLNVPNSLAPVGGSGKKLVADPRGEISTFEYGSAALTRVIALSQIQSVAKGAQLKPRFHDYAPCSWWVSGAGLQPGLFNVNTTSADSWAAVLRTYDANRSSDSAELGARVFTLASTLTGNFSGTSLAGGKTSGGPFRSVGAFWASNIVKDSLIEAGITDISQDEIQTAISAILAVRSDTFKIRAYGDATDPVDGAIKAKAYCEAVVQRTPELINSKLGRRFVIAYFRWLGPDDI